MARWTWSIGALAATAWVLAASAADAQPGVNAPSVSEPSTSEQRRPAPESGVEDGSGPEGPGEPASDVAPPKERMDIRGRVAKATSRSVEIDGYDGRTVSLAVDEDTELVRAGQPSKVTKSLKPGTEVRASYTTTRGHSTAERIEVLSSVQGPRGGTNGVGSPDSGDFLDSTGGALGDQPGSGRMGGSGFAGEGVSGEGSPAALPRSSQSGK